MKEKIIESILKFFSGKTADFYLVGGTALSLFYFQHRISIDLDFFTQRFNFRKIDGIIESIKKSEKIKFETVEKIKEEGKLKVAVYNIVFKKEKIKIDFVEDFAPLLKPLKIINEIPVASLEDIYLRKIFTVAGVGVETDITGRYKIIGGRKEAKDFYDLYFLSTTFMPLSQFTLKYCEKFISENLIRWFRTYDRFKIKSGLLDLKTNHKIDFQVMEKHFKKEIDKIIEREIDFL